MVGLLLAGDPVNPAHAARCTAVSHHLTMHRGFDRQVRVVAGSRTWTRAQPDDIATAMDQALMYEPPAPRLEGESSLDPLWMMRPTTLEILTSHPNGYVRQRAVQMLEARRPLAMVNRAIEWVPAIRAEASAVLTDGWRHQQLGTDWIWAGHAVLHRTTTVRLAPQLVEPALAALAAGPSTMSRPYRWRRRDISRAHEILDVLTRARLDLTLPEQQVALEAMVEFHERRLRPA